MHQLLVLGNGFDLACGLRSSYNDFFKWRFKKLFNIDDFKECSRICNKIETDIYIYNKIVPTQKPAYEAIMPISKPDYFKKYKDKWSKTDKTITRWDCFFLFANQCLNDAEKLQWQDVETIIYNVVSIALGCPYEENLNFKDSQSSNAFNVAITNLSHIGNNTQDSIATELLNELKKFEKVFADYIAYQVESTNYFASERTLNLFTSLTKADENNKDILKLDVLSFNYSVDERFKRRIKTDRTDIDLLTWSNIHGIALFQDSAAQSSIAQLHHYVNKLNLPAPIFGIDNHELTSDTVKDDPRIIFTKSFRLIDNNVNIIRENMEYENVDIISIFGHSLARADYSYFETIFDNCDLYSSKTRLEFYYYSGENQQTDKRLAAKKVINLLTDYGNTLDGRHGENIVNKMILENRLNIIPSNCNNH